MKKSYQQPEIWVEELEIESTLQTGSRIVTNTAGNAGLGYKGAGHGAARSDENHLWDEEEEDYGWDQL